MPRYTAGKAAVPAGILWLPGAASGVAIGGALGSSADDALGQVNRDKAGAVAVLLEVVLSVRAQQPRQDIPSLLVLA